MLIIPKSECLDVWIRLPRHKWPKSWSNIEDTVVSLERNWYGHPLAGLLWEKHFEEVLLELGWEKLPNWACPFVHWELGFFSVYVDDTKKWLERSRVWLPCGRNSWKLWSWRTNLVSWPLCIWDVLGVNANRLTSLLENIQRCLNHVFLLDQLDKYQGEKSLTLKQSRGPTTWKDMLENALSDTATWQTKQWRSYTKLQVFAWMTINSNRKNLNHLENYHKFAHKLLSNVCSWNDLEDQTFCGRSTSLQEQSQNGLRHAADDWQDWFHTFITQMNSDKVVM